MWNVKYGPQNSGDLAVHKKKLDEIRQWINQQALTPGLLIARGPAGCGKTTCIRILCQEAGVDLTEWSNPISTHQVNKSDDCYDSSYRLLASDNQMTQFWDFLLKSSRYCDITLANEDLACVPMNESLSSQAFARSKSKPEKKNHQIILLKDLPNTILVQPKQLTDLLKRYFSSTNCQAGLILVLTESDEGKNDFLRHFEVPLGVQTSFVKFNPSAVTLLSKALNRILAVHNKYCASNKSQSGAVFRLSPNQIHQLAAEAQGDIRYAVNQLEWAHRDQKFVSKGARTLSSRKRSQSSLSSPSSQAQELRDFANPIRDMSLGVLHIVGKILHHKGDLDTRAAAIAQDTYDKASSSLSATTLTLFLQQNYPQFRSSMEKTFASIDLLSHVDALISHKFDNANTVEPYAWWISCLGMMRQAESVSVGPGWCPIRKSPYNGIQAESSAKLGKLKKTWLGFPWIYTTEVLVTELLPFAAKLGHFHAKEIGLFKEIRWDNQFTEEQDQEVEEQCTDGGFTASQIEIVDHLNQDEEEDFIIEDYDDLEKIGSEMNL